MRRMFSENQIKELSKEAVENALIADKDIISKIKVVKEGNTYCYTFPKGVLPIRFYCDIFGAYQYFNYIELKLINGSGEVMTSTYIDDNNGQVQLSLQLSSTPPLLESVFAQLMYINISNNIDVQNNINGNWYEILNPQVGTKLYQHKIIDNSGTQYIFTLITDSPTPLDFSELDTYIKVDTYLKTINVILFIDDNNYNIMFDKFINYFINYSIYNSKFEFNVYDDWSLSNTTDTVTPL